MKDDEYKEYNRKKLIKFINSSETYDSVFSELDPKEIKSWIIKINKFSSYITFPAYGRLG